jgi:hypothetical protein
MVQRSMSTYEFWMHVLIWWRPFGLSLARVVGSMLIGCTMLSIILYSFFRWLIHVGTLADAVSMDLWLLNLLNKLVVCIILIQRPKSPFWKKKKFTWRLRRDVYRDFAAAEQLRPHIFMPTTSLHRCLYCPYQESGETFFHHSSRFWQCHKACHQSSN